MEVWGNKVWKSWKREWEIMSPFPPSVLLIIVRTLTLISKPTWLLILKLCKLYTIFYYTPMKCKVVSLGIAVHHCLQKNPIKLC